MTPKPLTLVRSHYYGDAVRVIFIIGALLVLWGLPRMSDILNVPAGIAIAGIVLLVVAAGLTNPAQRFPLVLNTLVSILFFAVFAYLGWSSYNAQIEHSVALANQICAILFLVASYLSVKSLRGAFVRDSR